MRRGSIVGGSDALAFGVGVGAAELVGLGEAENDVEDLAGAEFFDGDAVDEDAGAGGDIEGVAADGGVFGEGEFEFAFEDAVEGVAEDEGDGGLGEGAVDDGVDFDGLDGDGFFRGGVGIVDDECGAGGGWGCCGCGGWRCGGRCGGRIEGDEAGAWCWGLGG